ncbi:hypothetical protein AHAS_Ahas19G0276800 [Arachis hypogaea]
MLNKIITRVLTKLSVEKKTVVEEMRFNALRHIPELNVSHKLLRKLIFCFDLYHGCLDTRDGKIYNNPCQDKRCAGYKFWQYYTFHLLYLYFFFVIFILIYLY